MKNNLQYIYDPATPRLFIVEDGKQRGGFSGQMAIKQFMKQLETGANITIMGNKNNETERRGKAAKLRAIWISQGIDNYRSSILEPYGVTSTAQLNIEQLDELIKNYSAEYHKPANDEIRKLRSRVMVVLERIGIYKSKEDWAAVNAYLLQKRIAGKMMYQLNADELNVLLRKLHSIAKKKESEEKDELRLTIMN